MENLRLLFWLLWKTAIMPALKFFAVVFASILSLSYWVSAKEFTVNTGYAHYRGNQTNEKTVVYLGVPYAEPPVGERRWRAPLPLNTTRLSELDVVWDASSYPDFCIQGTTGDGDAGGAGSEDCLKVNIYTPVNASPKSKCTSRRLS